MVGCEDTLNMFVGDDDDEGQWLADSLRVGEGVAHAHADTVLDTLYDGVGDVVEDIDGLRLILTELL